MDNNDNDVLVFGSDTSETSLIDSVSRLALNENGPTPTDPSWPLNGFPPEITYCLDKLKDVSKYSHINIVPASTKTGLSKEVQQQLACGLSHYLVDAFHKTVQFHRLCRSDGVGERPTTMTELSTRVDELGSGIDEGLEARTMRLRSVASELSKAILEDGSLTTTPGTGVWDALSSAKPPSPTLVGMLRAVNNGDDYPAEVITETLSGVKARSETFIMRYKALCAKALSQEDILPVPPSILELHGLHWEDGKLLNSDNGSVSTGGRSPPKLEGATQEQGEDLGEEGETTDTVADYAIDSNEASDP